MRVRILNKKMHIFMQSAPTIYSSIISVMVILSAMSVEISVMELMQVDAILLTNLCEPCMIPFSLSHGSSLSHWSDDGSGRQRQGDFSWKGNGGKSDRQFRRAQQDRYNEIGFKMIILGRVRWLKRGDEVSKWMSSI